VKILCVFGKHQYGDPSRGVGIEYAAFLPALARLGHEVLHFESWDISAYGDGHEELNRALLAVVESQRPDILLAVQWQYELWLETLLILRARNDLATICWTTDDSWKYRQASRFLGTAFHAMTTTYPDVVAHYHQDGIPDVLLTQWAANAEWLQDPLPSEMCRHAVSFVGAAHGNRAERVAALRAQGIDVACFGHGWPGGTVPAERIPQIIRESVISLNFSNNFGRGLGQNQVKARTFEVPGAGGFLLTEHAPGLENYYLIGREIDVFHDSEELLRKVSYFLKHPAERDRIARAGFARTKQNHTYDIRMKEVLAFALAARDRSIGSSPRTAAPSIEQAVQSHRPSFFLRALRLLLYGPCRLVWGPLRGRRAARRLVYELSWRLAGRKTYTSAGWPGRMFPGV
jgi:spore maturation protein CgeB